MNNLKNTLLSSVMIFLALPVFANIRVNLALCENKINPLGVPQKEIVFSWELQSNEKNVTQTAYQLVISSEKRKLNVGNYDVYNTEIVKKSQSIEIAYNGKLLHPAYTYYWKVRVWDNNNRASAWSSVQNFTTGLFSEKDWEKAQWIAYEDLPDSMRVIPFVHGKMNANNPKCVRNAVSPLLRKEFKISKKVKQAILFMSGLGHYEASINGSKIGTAFLSPGWTNYDKTVLYNTYDITEQLYKGENTLGVILGNGFYSVSQERYVKCTGTFGNPKMIGMLKITYNDGSYECIVSDSSWKASPSPITFNNIYGGEDYDARLEQAGWNENSFNDENWRQAVLVTPPKGNLISEMDYPVQLLDSFEVKNVSHPEKGVSLYDFGQDISGILRIRVKGKAGQTVKLVPGELLKANGKVDQSINEPYTCSYTLKGGEEELWQPKFTYSAIRYAQVECSGSEGVEGLLELPAVLEMKLLHNRNSTPANGSFSCSNELFNRIYRLIDFSIKSNLQSYITDNPQREKLSWQGEQNFMRESVNYGYNVHNLYRSLVQNMMDAQHESGLVPDITPEYVKFEGPFIDSPEWGTTAILDMWFLYKSYGDIRTIMKAYPMMIKYAKYLEQKADRNILNYGLGDWLDVGPNHRSPANLTPMGITATAYYYFAIQSLSQMAAIIGNSYDAGYYKDLEKKIKVSFNKKFFDPDTKVYGTGSQTAMAIPLSLGIVEDKYKSSVLKNLVNSITAYGKMITSGDVGHRFFVNALYTNGQEQLLFDMTNRDDIPGYGYQLKKGATSLIETWDGRKSWNQLAMGHIFEWFYGGIAGISQDENSVAFKHIRICPQPVGNITYAKGNFHTPYGWVKTKWEKEGDSFTLNVEIPVNTMATVYLEVTSLSKVFVNGTPIPKLLTEDNIATIDLGSGSYEILNIE